VQPICERAKDRIGEDDCQSQEQGKMGSTETRQNTYCCRAPNCGCGVQTTYVAAIFEDYTRAKEADTSNHIGCDSATGRWIAIEQQPSHHEC
jgi:hypothetical protein